MVTDESLALPPALEAGPHRASKAMTSGTLPYQSDWEHACACMTLFLSRYLTEDDDKWRHGDH